uniref:Phospholipid phosphatase 4 n=1 Tax=Equus caballus TaxID=9796 RepID=A0A9L0SHH0_HORSE
TENGRGGRCSARTEGVRAAWSLRESPKRSSTTSPRACGSKRETGGRARRRGGAAGRAPASALPRRRARGPPTGGGRGAGSAQGGAAAAGLPRASPPRAAGARRGSRARGRRRREGAGSPDAPPAGRRDAGPGAWGAAGAASGSPGAGGGRFGLSPPRRQPAPARRPPPAPARGRSAPPSPPRVWRAGASGAAGAAESTRRRRRWSCSGRTMRELAIEIGVRALLFGVFVFTEFLDPFQRVIQPEEIWLYKNPLVQSDNIPTRLMFAISFLTPLAVICVVKIIRRTDKTEIKEAFLAVSLALALNGVCTNTIKLIVGRWSDELRNALHR